MYFLKSLILFFLCATTANAAPVACAFSAVSTRGQRLFTVFRLDTVTTFPNSDLPTYSYKGVLASVSVDAAYIDGLYSVALQRGNRVARQDFQETISLKFYPTREVEISVQCPYLGSIR